MPHPFFSFASQNGKNIYYQKYCGGREKKKKRTAGLALSGITYQNIKPDTRLIKSHYFQI